MERNLHFPPKIKKLLEKKGYFNLTHDERIKLHKKSMKNLEKVSHFNYEAGKKALKELRGE